MTMKRQALDLLEEKNNTCSNVSLSSPGPNVALRKSVTLSSTYNASPEKMVDGSRNGNFPNFTHTDLERNPYSIVDLSRNYQISSMFIVNRKDQCCGIGDNCTVVFDTAHDGRYIKLLIEATEYLNLCEVEA